MPKNMLDRSNGISKKPILNKIKNIKNNISANNQAINKTNNAQINNSYLNDIYIDDLLYDVDNIGDLFNKFANKTPNATKVKEFIDWNIINCDTPMYVGNLIKMRNILASLE